MRVIRGLIDSVVEGSIKRLSGRGISGETLTNREFLQQYGLTSLPLEDGEYIAIKDGGNIFIVASDDRRYRVALEEGEVALYDHQGQKVHLKKEGAVDIVSTGTMTLTAATKIRMEAPAVEASGAFKSETSVEDPNGTMQAMRDAYNPHKHAETGSTTGTPDSEM